MIKKEHAIEIALFSLTHIGLFVEKRGHLCFKPIENNLDKIFLASPVLAHNYYAATELISRSELLDAIKDRVTCFDYQIKEISDFLEIIENLKTPETLKKIASQTKEFRDYLIKTSYFQNIPLAKPPYDEETQGTHETQLRSIFNIHKDSSLSATQQLSLEIKYQDQSIEDIKKCCYEHLELIFKSVGILKNNIKADFVAFDNNHHADLLKNKLCKYNLMIILKLMSPGDVIDFLIEKNMPISFSDQIEGFLKKYQGPSSKLEALAFHNVKKNEHTQGIFS